MVHESPFLPCIHRTARTPSSLRPASTVLTDCRPIDDVAQSTPTFVVESGEPRRGYDAWAEVQRDILDAELARQDVSELDVEVVKTDNGYRASVAHANLLAMEGTQLTLMVLEHGKTMPTGVVNPGGDHRDRVLVGLAECSVDHRNITANIGLLSATVETTCESSFSIEFEAITSWSVLLVHETTNEVLSDGEHVWALWSWHTRPCPIRAEQRPRPFS